MTKEHNPKTEQEQTSSHRKRSVATYLAILFVAAILLLVLAYFMQERAIAYYGTELMNGMY